MIKRCLTAVLVCVLMPACAFALIDEDSGRGNDVRIRYMLPKPAAQKKFESFMKQVSGAMVRSEIPEGRYKLSGFKIDGPEVISRKAVEKIIKGYLDRPLFSEDVRECIDAITKEHRRRGYVTSYADFVGLSQVAEGSTYILNVKIVAGKVGEVKIEGNRFFSEDVIRDRLDVEEGDYFNLKDLQFGAYKTSHVMDRRASMDLEYDKDSGLSDVNLMVKDMAPVHVTFEMDTYGSWFINQNRYRIMTLHNNLTGHDDQIQFKMQWADKSAHELYDVAYRLPLSNRFWWEAYFMPYKAEDYFHDMAGVHKRAWKTYTYLHYNMIERPGRMFVWDLGFVYKHIDWQLPLGSNVKRDHFSGILFGFDLDFTDKHGRTIITDDLEVGIPGLFGATEDGVEETSVKGADGKYTRNHLIIARRQKLFKGTDLLFKSHLQVADAVLTGVNAFSVGGFFGIIDMRGYPRAQAYGENGFSVSSGFSFAPYFLPRNMKVPGSKGTFFETTQLFAVCDWATVNKRRPLEDEAANTTLASAVVGMQMMLPEKFFLRIDLGTPVTDDETNDGKDYHAWIRISKMY